jgi:hypothetical protein
LGDFCLLFDSSHGHWKAFSYLFLLTFVKELLALVRFCVTHKTKNKKEM